MSRRQTAWLLLAAATGWGVAPAAAQRMEPRPPTLPTIEQEVFLADLVYPQERGEVQLTVNSRLQHGAHSRILAEYGITDRLQASVTSPISERDPGEGEDAWSLGALYALVPTGPVALSASGEVDVVHGEAPVWTRR